MTGIEELSNKLNMIYNNCTVITDKSCICQDSYGIYRLYKINTVGYEECGRYIEFVKLTKLYNKFRVEDSKLYGICDNYGKVINKTLYEDVSTVKNNCVVVKEIGAEYGLLDLDTMNKKLNCKYSEVRMYDNSEYLAVAMKYYGIVELYNYDGTRAIDSRFNEIIMTDKIILCRLDISDMGAFEIYDYSLKLIAGYQDNIKVYSDKGYIGVKAKINNIEKCWEGLKLQEKIETKVGLSI